MTKNNPAEDAAVEAQTETETEAEVAVEELSEAEIERKRRQEERREAKRQKQELARIRKEMRGPTSKWVKIALAVVIALIIGVTVAGYFIYCSYSVGLQRDSFMEDFNRADLSRLRQFAPAQLRHVEELKQQAENQDGTLSWQQVVAKYREAEDALAQAANAASGNSDAYDSALSRFRVLKEEATKNKVDQYAHELWSRIEEAEASATPQSSQSFTVTLATEKLTQAIELLEKTSTTYPKLRDFDAVASELRRQLASLQEKEWQRNVADAWGNLQNLLSQAGTAQEATDWDTAAESSKKAISLIAPALEKINGLKSDAAAAVDIMEQAIKAAEAAGTPGAQPAAWAKTVAAAGSAREAFTQSDYATATRLAQETTTMLGQAGESVRQANQTLEQTLKQVKALYDRAVADGTFFSLNAAAEWRDVQAQYRRIPDLHRQNKAFELVDLSATLKKRLETLIQDHDQVLADVQKAESQLEVATKQPLFPHLPRNYPEAYDKVEDMRRTAARRRDRGEVREARDLLVQAADELNRLLKDLDAVHANVLQLRTSLIARRERFQDGITRFMSAENASLERNLGRIDQMLGSHLYTDAAALAQELDRILPAQRYQVALAGTIVDYEKGVMWIADGSTADGGNSGQLLDWYAALKWAAAIRFGGYDDWRLPTEEELRDLTRLSAAERNRLFPGTIIGVHWTRIPAIDVEAALTVDVKTGNITRDSKRKPHYVRAVRQPR